GEMGRNRTPGESHEAFGFAGTTPTTFLESLMRFRLSCLAVTLAAASMAGPASGQECAPAWIDGDPSALPEAWRRALFTLVAETTHEGQPWSCTGARVSLRA